jgi:hypothetical protein
MVERQDTGALLRSCFAEMGENEFYTFTRGEQLLFLKEGIDKRRQYGDLDCDRGCPNLGSGNLHYFCAAISVSKMCEAYRRVLLGEIPHDLEIVV